MNNLNLDRCWKLCKQMWKYVAYERELGSSLDVDTLKRIWLRKHGFRSGQVAGSCFFCEYSNQISKEFDLGRRKECAVCPGALINPAFDCTNDKYDYRSKPQEFYKEILRLDKIG